MTPSAFSHNFLKITLLCFCVLLVPQQVRADDINYSGEDGWALSSANDLIYTGTLTGTWTIPSGSSANSKMGGLNLTGPNTITNQGIINLTGTNNSGNSRYLYGMYDSSAGNLVNRGTITVTTYGDNLNPRGMYADYGLSVVNWGTINTISHGDNCRTQGINAFETNSTLSNYGTITSTSHGTNSRVRTFLASGSGMISSNSGTLNAITHGSSSDAQAVFLDGSSSGQLTFTNTGTLSAQAFGSGTAYAIYADDWTDVHLQTGTSILSGAVYSDRDRNNLYLDGEGTVDFNITGTWGNLYKTGTGTWILQNSIASGIISATDIQAGTFKIAQGSTFTTTDLTVASDATLSVYASGQSTASITSTNSPTINGSIVVHGTANGVDDNSTLMSTSGTISGYNLVTDSNPNFTITDTSSSSGAITVSTALTPKSDTSSLGTTSTLASTGQFAKASATRSTSRLAGSSFASNDEPILLASAGDLTGILGKNDPNNYFFIQPVIGKSWRSAGNAEGYDAYFLGLTAGIDTFISDDWLLGVMAGIGHTTLDFNGGTFYDNDRENQWLFTVGPYIGYRSGQWRFTDSLTYTRVAHDYKRNAGMNQIAKASYTSDVVRNELTGAYVWGITNNWSLTPKATLIATWLHRGAFSEDNAANAVSYDSLNKFFTEGALSARATGSYMHEGKKLAFYVGAGVRQSLSANDITVRQFLSTSSAQVTTKNDDTHIMGETGLILTKNNFTFNLGYQGEVSKSEQSHTLSTSLRWAF